MFWHRGFFCSFQFCEWYKGKSKIECYKITCHKGTLLCNTQRGTLGEAKDIV